MDLEHGLQQEQATLAAIHVTTGRNFYVSTPNIFPAVVVEFRQAAAEIASACSSGGSRSGSARGTDSAITDGRAASDTAATKRTMLSTGARILAWLRSTTKFSTTCTVVVASRTRYHVQLYY